MKLRREWNFKYFSFKYLLIFEVLIKILRKNSQIVNLNNFETLKTCKKYLNITNIFLWIKIISNYITINYNI